MDKYKRDKEPDAPSVERFTILTEALQEVMDLHHNNLLDGLIIECRFKGGVDYLFKSLFLTKKDACEMTDIIADRCEEFPQHFFEGSPEDEKEK